MSASPRGSRAGSWPNTATWGRSAKMVGRRFVVGGVRYELLDPMKSWRIVAAC